MNKILAMLEAAETSNHIDFAHFSRQAIPDIKHIVEWVNGAEHGNLCERRYGWKEICTCGLSEIQSLIRR